MWVIVVIEPCAWISELLIDLYLLDEFVDQKWMLFCCWHFLLFDCSLLISIFQRRLLTLLQWETLSIFFFDFSFQRLFILALIHFFHFKSFSFFVISFFIFVYFLAFSCEYPLIWVNLLLKLFFKPIFMLLFFCSCFKTKRFWQIVVLMSCLKCWGLLLSG